MKEYQTDKIRNIALVSHSGAGKTTLIERFLLDTGKTNRMGSVTQGTATTDFEPEELERNSSIATAIASLEFRDHKFNFLDTPGYIDFVGEVNAALHVADSAVVFVEASSGVEVGTEIVWAEAKKRNVPMMLVASKMDRENVRSARVLSSIQESFSDEARIVQLQVPIGEGVTFKGVADLITNKAYGLKGESFDIPEEMADEVEEARVALIEAAAESDETLMERYFESDTLTADEIIEGLKITMSDGSVVPIAYVAGEPGLASEILLMVMQRLLPAPNEGNQFETDTGSYDVSDDSPLTAFVFKTREDQYGKTSYLRVFGGKLENDSRALDSATGSEVRVTGLGSMMGKEIQNVGVLHAGDIGAAVKLGDTQTNNTLCDKATPQKMGPIDQPNPIFSVSVHPVSQADVSKLSEATSRIQMEDPTLRYYYEPATRQSIMSGMGDVHIGVAVKRLASKFGVNVTTDTPLIAYRETITKTSDAEHTHKKQSGGAGQYGRVMLRVEPLDDDAEFEFDEEIFGGSISGPFVVATEKGCRQAVEEGPIAGYPVVGVKAIVYDGKMHPVDSKEIAFQVAGRESFRKAMMSAGPILLEPLYNVTVTVPSDNMGDVMSDFNTRRARVSGMDQFGARAIVKAEVPLSEMQRYLADLRSMTAGRGVYSMEFARYGHVPSHFQDKVIEETKKMREASE